VADRASFVVGDGAQASLENHDWVILDRVICCYPDASRLMSNVTGAARHRVAFSLPTSRGWRGLVNQVLRVGENLGVRIGWSGCPGYVHDVDRIESTLAAAGFVPVRSERLGLWYAAVWDRKGDES
jgi:magnesium-protoporphyrin O-methyltransferase